VLNTRRCSVFRASKSASSCLCHGYSTQTLDYPAWSTLRADLGCPGRPLLVAWLTLLG
jgi:hypothetical protein